MRQHSESKGKKLHFFAVFKVFLGFVLIFCVLLMERRGITYESFLLKKQLLSAEQTKSNKPLAGMKDCLLLTDSEEPNSALACAEYEQLLTDMRISCETEDVRSAISADRLAEYSTVVFLLPDLSPLGDNLLSICDWVQEGGRLLIGMPVAKSTAFTTMQRYLGIVDSGYDFKTVSDFKAAEGFMLGGDRIYRIEDPYESAMNVGLDEDCRIYASSADGYIPLIWTRNYGEGKFAVCNFGYCTKAYRGIYAAAYSLLEDVCIYPVINASTFYLDDWPSPVPSGDGQYIQRDYQMDVQTFYSKVWWPDVMTISEKYDIPFTGLIIENYDDETDGYFPENNVVSDFSYYGNMLLDEGGELGYHGYNHQPLCDVSYEYKEDLGYQKWPSRVEMKTALTELIRFSEGLFPDTKLQVYVPPSNVLSPEGRQMLGSEFPNIRVIASTYLDGGSVYSQEFEVASDGIVETPRIISSCVLDEYMRLTAFSELNLHYVNSHFMHPDDLLDQDRGAALGWETLKGRLTEYLDWLDNAAPQIRHLTGSGMAAAVQRFSGVSVERQNTQAGIRLVLDGTADDNYFLVRINDGGIFRVDGGNLSHLTGNLYLLHTKEKEVMLYR